MYLPLLLVRLALTLLAPPGRRRDDRGDVPGWVMITVLTIGMAIVILAFAQDQLMAILRSALNQAK